MTFMKNNINYIFCSINGEEYNRIDAYNNDGIDVQKIVQDREDDEFNLNFVYTNTFFKGKIVEVSDNRKEIRVTFEDIVGLEISGLLTVINSIYVTPNAFGCIDGSNIVNVIGHERDTVSKTFIFRLDDSISDVDYIDFHSIVGDTKNISFVVDEKIDEDQPIVLKGHRRDFELDSFFGESSDKKQYKDVVNAKDSLSSQEYSNIRDDINIDYSEFENHVFFGSAYSKVSNVAMKLDNIRNLEMNVDTLNSNTEKIKIKNTINDIIDALSDYEIFVYKNEYENSTLQEFDGWIESELRVAEDYDATNNDFMLYSVPEYFLENDDENLFTNFMLLIGEFMDNLWAHVKSLENVYNFDITSSQMISDRFIDTMMKDLGFDLDYKYTNADFSRFFEDTTNLKKISNQIAKRLLYSLPFMTKLKGTNTSINSILNIFGIPNDFFQIYEFGYISNRNESKRTIREYDWYASLTGADNSSINITNTDLNHDTYTIEIVTRNLVGNGNLLYFDASNYISYSVANDEVTVTIIQNGANVYSSPAIKNNNLWNLFVIRRDINASYTGSFKNYTLNTIDGGVVDVISNDFNFQTGSPIHSTVEVFNSGGGDVTEIQFYNSPLSDEVIDYHSLDIRNVSTDDSSILANFSIYRPDTTSYVIESTEGNFVLSTGATKEDFNKDNFFMTSLINTSMSDMFTTDKVYAFNRTLKKQLSSKRLATETDNVDFIFDLPFIGIFLSPTDMFDKHIFREFGYNNDFVIDDNTKNDFSFSNLEKKQYLKNQVKYNFYKENTLYNILSLFNNKVYNVLKEFLPASSNLMTGLFIKNSVLDKNKTVKRGKNLTHRESPIVKYNADTSYLSFTSSKVKAHIDVKQEISSNQAEKSEDVIITIYDGSRSGFILPIETFDNRAKWSPWLIRSIQGDNRNSRQLSAESVEELLNKGARILVK